MAIPMPGRCAYCGRIDGVSGILCVACQQSLAVSSLKPQAMARQQLMQNAIQNYLGNPGGASIVPMPFGTAGVFMGVAVQAAQSGQTTPREPLPSAGMKVEDLIGWRVWRVRNGHLWSYSADYAWMPGEVSEGDPGDHDSAGIWAFKDKRRAFQKAVESGGSYVWGSVLLWGHVVEHKDGYRASKARIVSIGGATRDVTREVLADLCENHGVAVPTHVSRSTRPEETSTAIEYGEQPPYIVVPAHPELMPNTPWPLFGALGALFSMLGLLWAFY